jgi:hypothetical protein
MLYVVHFALRHGAEHLPQARRHERPLYDMPVKWQHCSNGMHWPFISHEAQVPHPRFMNSPTAWLDTKEKHLPRCLESNPVSP